MITIEENNSLSSISPASDDYSPFDSDVSNTSANANAIFTTRYYKNPFPEINDCVMTRIVNLTPEGSNLILPEYNNLNGYVTTYELSTKVGRTYKVNVKVNDYVPMRVINIDIHKNYVLVTRKNLTEEEIKEFKERFKYASNNNKICDEINTLYRNYIKINVLSQNYDFARQIIWDMYERLNSSDSESEEDNTNQEHNIFKIVNQQILGNPSCVLLQYDNDFKEKMLNNLSKRITYKNFTLEAAITLVTTKGLQNLKNVLEQTSMLDKNGIKYTTVVNPPKYRITIEGNNLTMLNDIMSEMLDNMIKISKNNNVTMNVIYSNKTTKDYSKEDMVQLKFLSDNELTNLFRE